MSGDEPSPHELARDLDQLERQLGSRLDRIEAIVEAIRRDMVVPSTFTADQARQDQSIKAMESELKTMRDESRNNRRMLWGSLVFPIIVAIVTALMIAGGGSAGS